MQKHQGLLGDYAWLWFLVALFEAFWRNSHMSGKHPEFFRVSVDLFSCKTLPKEVFLIFQRYGYENRGTFFELIAAPGVTWRSLKEEISAHLGSADRVYVRGFSERQFPEVLVPLSRRSAPLEKWRLEALEDFRFELAEISKIHGSVCRATEAKQMEQKVHAP